MRTDTRINILIRRVRSQFHGNMVAALSRTFAARGVASLGSFLLIIALGHLYGTEGVGAYALAQSFVVAVAVFSRWGMDNALVRFVGRDLQSPKVGAYLRYACKRTAIVSLVGAILIGIFRSELASILGSHELRSLLLGIAIATPAYVLAFLLSGFMAAIRRPATACMLQNGAIAVITTLMLLIIHFIAPRLGLAGVGAAYAISAWAVGVWGVYAAFQWWHATGRTAPRLSHSDIREFKHSASAFLATDVASFLLSVVGLWVAGYLLPTSQVGLYKAAAQLAMLIGVILIVINLIIPTRFSRLFFAGDLVGLERLARRGAIIGVVLGAIPLAACFFAPQLILRAVGHDFEGAALLLQILAAGQFFNLCCGSVGHVLNMSGHETVSRNIAWASNIVGLLVLVAGTYFIGIVGLALGVALAMSLRKIVGVYFAWRCVGIWVLPIPNVLRALRVDHPHCVQ